MLLAYPFFPALSRGRRIFNRRFGHRISPASARESSGSGSHGNCVARVARGGASRGDASRGGTARKVLPGDRFCRTLPVAFCKTGREERKGKGEEERDYRERRRRKRKKKRRRKKTQISFIHSARARGCGKLFRGQKGCGKLFSRRRKDGIYTVPRLTAGKESAGHAAAGGGVKLRMCLKCEQFVTQFGEKCRFNAGKIPEKPVGKRVCGGFKSVPARTLLLCYTVL